MMKFLCTLLALLVLTLSVQPACATVSSPGSCCNGTACNDETGGSTESHEDECNTSCNPFQVCGCCAFGVVVPHQLSFDVTASFPLTFVNWGVLSVDVADEPVSGFWQPPRSA